MGPKQPRDAVLQPNHAGSLDGMNVGLLRPRVLVVDDDQWVRKASSRMLAPTWEVETAESAEAAARLLENRRFDAVLTDYEMPGRDGLWLLGVVRSRWPGTRRVLISGSDPGSVSEYIREGLVECFLTKPASRSAMLASLGPR